jgi:asparagine synthase (glutamine-hydrolysing)
VERGDILRAMGAQLARRGPDDEQFLDDAHMSLVFRRLSIVDLPNGRQPIWNEDHTICVCVNGEIYNHLQLRKTLRDHHEFRTRSDSEIVLHLYEELGRDAVRHLIGKYALVVWDAARKRVLFARDRLGIKPLYLVPSNDGLIFGSELKALLCHPRCPRTFCLSDLQLGYGRLERVPTFVTGVDFLPAGHLATYDSAGLRVVRYWSLDEVVPREGETESYFVDRYRECLSAAVRDRLMSDVPIGAFLSGGVDSAAVVAIAKAHGQVPACFTAVTRTTVDNGDAAGAVETARVLDVPLHQVLLDEERLQEQLDLSLPALESCVWMMDSPRFDVEWLYKVQLHRAAKAHVPDMKVILLGQGADEFAGGYSDMHTRPRGGWIEYLNRDLAREHNVRTGVPAELAELLRPDPAGSIYRREMENRLLMLQWHNLWHEDRSSAVAGMESRIPFLDHRLVELLASVPEHLHEALFWQKRIVRLAARTWLPESITGRTKTGFYHAVDMSPVHAFLRSLVARNVGPFVERYLRDEGSILDRAAFERLAADVSANPTNGAALATELWCMCIAIFADMCRDISRFSAEAIVRPHVLPEVGRPPAAWRRPPAVEEGASWRAADVVALAGEGFVAERLGPEGGDVRLLYCVAGRIEGEIEISPDNRFLVDLLRLVADRSRKRTVGDLAGALNLDVAVIMDALQSLASEGWIVRRGTPSSAAN